MAADRSASREETIGHAGGVGAIAHDDPGADLEALSDVQVHERRLGELKPTDSIPAAGP